MGVTTTAFEPELMTKVEVMQYLRYGESTLRRKVAQGLMPQPIGGGRLQRWRRSELLRWVEDGQPALDSRKRK